ncbi:MAG: VOC family protein [Desulfomonilaceae bacterium]|nr:VOC family protein [Desulfomonilaceae bacterium]
MSMRLPAGHARRLFLGFSCSIMFLVVFALLIAHNTEAVSSSISKSPFEDYPLTVGIPTDDPVTTIDFYKKLGFRATEGLSGSLDVVRMEKRGTPYKLEICHSRFSEAGPVSGGVSGMSFEVECLVEAVSDLKTKGLQFVETGGTRDGVRYASLKDPNGISIKLFEP